VKRGKDYNYVLTWAEDVRPVVGEGLSRSSNPKAPLWEITVEFERTPRMKTTIRAANKAEAKKFATNRHPDAKRITIHGKQ
jgi:hypothetical protein